MDSDTTFNIITVVKFIALACAGGFSILGAMTESKRNGKVTRWGRVAIIGVILSTLFSVSLLGLEQKALAERKRKADDERLAAQIQATKEKEEANQKFADTVQRLEDIRGVAEVNLEKTARNLEQTTLVAEDVKNSVQRLEDIRGVAGNNLEQTSKNLEQTTLVAEDVKKSIEEQARIVAQTRGIAGDLSVSLEAQRTQLSQLENIALDRDLNGIELSWEPSPAQWDEIVRAYEKLPGPRKDYFPHTTITGERFYEHWRIIFKPLLRPQGLLEFPPVLTSQTAWEEFYGVLKKAIPSYFVVELGSNPGIVLSGSGFYPSSVSIARRRIVLTLRPPETRIALKLLANKTVTFRGSREIATIRLASKDAGVCLDQTINLDWGEPTDEFEPSKSGPHPLDLQFATLSKCQ